MPIGRRGGIRKLSQLEIDVSKDWGAYLIKNLGAAVDAADAVRKVQAILQSVMTARGDILWRGDSEAQRLGGDFGPHGYNFVHCIDTGKLGVEWMDVHDLIVYLSGAVNRAILLPTVQIPSVDISLQVAEDHSGGAHVATPPGLTIPTPTVDKAAAAVSPQAVGGGVAHDDDVGDTDETAETNNPTANDMHLLPSPGAVGDGFYLGLSSQFDWVCLNIGTPGAGVWTITYKYWNGTTWTALSLKYDETDNFRAAAGKHWVHFVRPGDWALTTILAMNLYWIKPECTAYTSMTTQPLGTQAWVGAY